MFSWQALCPIASHGWGAGACVCAQVEREGGREGHSTGESRRVQLSEKTSRVVSGGQSTFAENPVLLLLIVVHISLPVCVTLVHSGSGWFLVFVDSDTFHRLSPPVMKCFIFFWALRWQKPLMSTAFCPGAGCRSLAVCVSHENVTSVDPEVRTVIWYGWIPHHMAALLKRHCWCSEMF